MRMPCDDPYSARLCHASANERAAHMRSRGIFLLITRGVCSRLHAARHYARCAVCALHGRHAGVGHIGALHRATSTSTSTARHIAGPPSASTIDTSLLYALLIAPRCMRSPLSSSQRPCSPSPPRTTAILGAIDTYAPSHSRWSDARCAQPLRTQTRTRSVRYHLPYCSRAQPDSGRHWSGSYASPCFPYSRYSWCSSQGEGSAQPRSAPATRSSHPDDVECAAMWLLVCECVQRTRTVYVRCGQVVGAFSRARSVVAFGRVCAP